MIDGSMALGVHLFRRAKRPGTYLLFIIHSQPGHKFGTSSNLRPPAGRQPGNYSLFTIHSYFFCPQGNNLRSCPKFGPLLFFSEEKKRSAPGWRRRRGFGADEDGPVLLQDGLVLYGKHGRSLVQTLMPPASLSAAASLVRTLPATSSLFTLTSYFREARPGGWIQGGGRSPRPWPF